MLVIQVAGTDGVNTDHVEALGQLIHKIWRCFGGWLPEVWREVGITMPADAHPDLHQDLLATLWIWPKGVSVKPGVEQVVENVLAAVLADWAYPWLVRDGRQTWPEHVVVQLRMSDQYQEAMPSPAIEMGQNGQECANRIREQILAARQSLAELVRALRPITGGEGMLEQIGWLRLLLEQLLDNYSVPQAPNRSWFTRVYQSRGLPPDPGA